MYSNEVNNHLENSLNEVRVIFLKAIELLENIKPGETLPITKISTIIGKEVGIDGVQLYTTLKFLGRNYPGLIYRRGSKGGFHRPIEDSAK